MTPEEMFEYHRIDLISKTRTAKAMYEYKQEVLLRHPTLETMAAAKYFDKFINYWWGDSMEAVYKKGIKALDGDE